MADETLSAIDEDSKAMLEDHVKKGKARKFILITKGATIKSLIVFKKGPYGPKINKAKKDGFRGEAACGVITGKGVNITFKLPGTAEVSSAMKTEGNVYEGEPCKIAKLRAFFKDEADLKFKPEFQVVKQLSDVTTVSELEDETEENLGKVALGDVEAAEQKQKLIAALKKMTAIIQKAVTEQPTRKEEILEPAVSIKDHLQADRLEEAKTELLGYNDFLQELIGMGQPTATTAAPPPPPAPDQISPKESEWNWRTKELTPKLKKVLREQLGDFSQVGATFKQAQAAKSTNIEEAVQLLKRCSQMVELALSESEGDWADATADDYRQIWNDVEQEFVGQRTRGAASLSKEQLVQFDTMVTNARTAAGQGEFQMAVELALKAASLDAAAAKASSQQLQQDVVETARETGGIEEGGQYVDSLDDDENDAAHQYVDSLDDEDDVALQPSVLDHGDGSRSPSPGTPKPSSAEADPQHSIIEIAYQTKKACLTTSEQLQRLRERVRVVHENHDASRDEISAKFDAGNTSDEELNKLYEAAEQEFATQLEAIIADAKNIDILGQREFERFKTKLISSCEAHLGKGEPPKTTIGSAFSDNAEEKEETKVGAVVEDETQKRFREALQQFEREQQSEQSEQMRATLQQAKAELTERWNTYEAVRVEIEDFVRQNDDQFPELDSPIAKRERECQDALSDTVERVLAELTRMETPFDDSLYKLKEDVETFCLTLSGKDPRLAIPEPENFGKVTWRMTQVMMEAEAQRDAEADTLPNANVKSTPTSSTDAKALKEGSEREQAEFEKDLKSAVDAITPIDETSGDQFLDTEGLDELLDEHRKSGPADYSRRLKPLRDNWLSMREFTEKKDEATIDKLFEKCQADYQDDDFVSAMAGLTRLELEIQKIQRRLREERQKILDRWTPVDGLEDEGRVVALEALHKQAQSWINHNEFALASATIDELDAATRAAVFFAAKQKKLAEKEAAAKAAAAENQRDEQARQHRLQLAHQLRDRIEANIYEVSARFIAAADNSLDTSVADDYWKRLELTDEEYEQALRELAPEEEAAAAAFPAFVTAEIEKYDGDGGSVNIGRLVKTAPALNVEELIADRDELKNVWKELTERKIDSYADAVRAMRDLENTRREALALQKRFASVAADKKDRFDAIAAAVQMIAGKMNNRQLKEAFFDDQERKKAFEKLFKRMRTRANFEKSTSSEATLKGYDEQTEEWRDFVLKTEAELRSRDESSQVSYQAIRYCNGTNSGSITAAIDGQKKIDALEQGWLSGRHKPTVEWNTLYHAHLAGGSWGLAFGYYDENGDGTSIVPCVIDVAFSRDDNMYKWETGETNYEPEGANKPW